SAAGCPRRGLGRGALAGALPSKTRVAATRSGLSRMNIGIAFDLKADLPAAPELPDDWQEEFDSPDTVAAIAAALRARGHRVTELGNGRELVEALLADPPELVFNIAEGQGVGRSR